MMGQVSIDQSWPLAGAHLERSFGGQNPFRPHLKKISSNCKGFLRKTTQNPSKIFSLYPKLLPEKFLDMPLSISIIKLYQESLIPTNSIN
jgi:hypothetical protein